MEVINWGIIGCGDVTEVKSGPAFNKVPNSHLAAVMRRSADLAMDYALRHNVPKWYADADALVNDPAVNAIYVATPPSSHLAYVLQAIKAGKPVYVEKPMTLNYEQAQQMVDAAKANQVKLTVAHYRREQPMFKQLKMLIDQSAIGTVKLVTLQMLQPKQSDMIANTPTNWRVDPKISGGGLFHDLAPHQLDLMLYFFGDVDQSTGLSTSSSKGLSADDLVTGHIAFKNGVIFNGCWCYSVAEGDQLDCCEIYGSNGKITFPVFGHQFTLTQNGKPVVYNFPPLPHVQQPMIAKVVDYFLDKGDNPCSGEEGLATMRLLDSFTSK